MKRPFSMIAALLICGAIGTAAMAQTPAQFAKYNRYLSNHPGVEQRLAANPALGNVSSYMASSPGAQNYSGAYQTQYMKNLATYNNYMAAHPGLATNQGLGNSAYQTQYMKNLATYNNYMATHPGLAASQGLSNPYVTGYPGQYPYSTPQLAGSPLTALVAPFMSRTPAMQNYGGGYGGYGAAPMYSTPYAASYARPMPYGSAYGQYAAAPMSRPWRHHQGSLSTTSGASSALAASHPFASAAHHSWWAHNH